MFRYGDKTENTCRKAVPVPVSAKSRTVGQIEEKLSGTLCGRRPTFRAARLAETVRSVYNAGQTA